MAISTSTAFAYNSATISNTAQTMLVVGFSAAEIDRADVAYITVDTQAVRYRYDGSAPTAADGHQLDAGDKWLLVGNQNIRNLQFIRAGSSDGFVAITLESFEN
jgi:hypothetical protein